jgi:hypothetical protein
LLLAPAFNYSVPQFSQFTIHEVLADDEGKNGAHSCATEESNENPREIQFHLNLKFQADLASTRQSSQDPSGTSFLSSAISLIFSLL